MDLEKYGRNLNKWYERQLAATEKVLNRNYRDLSNTILNQIRALFDKYAQDGVLTYQEMNKFNRLQKYFENLQSAIDDTYKVNNKDIGTALTDIYSYAYYYMGWSLEKETLKPLRYSKLKQEEIKQVLDYPIHGSVLSEVVEKNRNEAAYDLKRAITQALVAGSTYKTLADNIKGVIEKDYNKSVRVARTETHAVKERAVLNSAIKANREGVILEKVWLNMGDSRVRRTSKANHVQLEGQRVGVEELFDIGNGLQGITPGNTGYPQHDINCRCISIFEIVDIKGKTDSELGRQTFQDFEKKL